MLKHGHCLTWRTPHPIRTQTDKLIQLGERVFNLTDGKREERAKATIDAIEAFFNRMGSGHTGSATMV
jgi:alcohol dehydrogenase YqhD (iron-dependent ADH family)